MIDFGASDAYLDVKKMDNLKRSVLYVPVCSGAVVLTYNLKGFPNIKLTADVIADIYLGKIKRWNHKRIREINPNLKLPRKKIVPIYRADGSGTTFIFTDFLSKVNQKWKEKIGRGKAVNWSKGVASKGNAGVAGLVKQIPGSIGYVSSIYAIQSERLPMASIQNQKGNYIEPTLESISLAGNTPIPEDTRVSLTNTTAEQGYPICGLTWVLIYKDQFFNDRSKEQAIETVNLLKWMVTEGQRFGRVFELCTASKFFSR